MKQLEISHVVGGSFDTNVIDKSMLCQVVAEVLEVEPALLQTDFDLTTLETFDSMHILLLIVNLEEQINIKIGLEELDYVRFYGDIEQLAEAQGAVLCYATQV